MPRLVNPLPIKPVSSEKDPGFAITSSPFCQSRLSSIFSVSVASENLTWPSGWHSAEVRKNWNDPIGGSRVHIFFLLGGRKALCRMMGAFDVRISCSGLGDAWRCLLCRLLWFLRLKCETRFEELSARARFFEGRAEDLGMIAKPRSSSSWGCWSPLASMSSRPRFVELKFHVQFRHGCKQSGLRLFENSRQWHP